MFARVHTIGIDWDDESTTLMVPGVLNGSGDWAPSSLILRMLSTGGRSSGLPYQAAQASAET